MQGVELRLRWLERRKAARGDHLALGAVGERIAARLLRKNGVRILGRNAALGGVEVDLLGLAPDRACLIVIEVKCRRVSPDAGPVFATEAAVDSVKLGRLLRAGRAATRRFRAPPGAFRIDVVAVDVLSGDRARVRWLQDCAPR